jgi:peptide/nickel transport system permease protein
VPDFAAAGMGKITQISTGYDHIVAVDENGRIHVWGVPFPRGILESIDGTYPRRVQGNVKLAVAGRQFTIVIDNDGVVHYWGGPMSSANVNVSIANRYPSPAKDVVTNTISAMIHFEDDTALVINPRDAVFKAIPDEIQGHIKQVALTDRNGAALLHDGTVVVWGGNERARNEMPADIQGRVVSIQGGVEHFTVLLDDGSVRSWGNNQFRQEIYPKNYRSGVSIFSGYHFNYALDADGNVTTWGLRGFLLGTDDKGRDIFPRLWQAGRYSLFAGSIAVIVSTAIGLTLGGLAGFYGKSVDMFIMRLAEVVGAIPFLPLVIILSQTIVRQWGLDQIQRLVAIMVISGVLGWGGIMRMTRGIILRVRSEEYVTAARALGVREGKIISRHVMPNVLTIVLVPIALGLAGSMLTESGLSFIGFGVAEPIPTWGNMLTGSNDSVIMRIYWWRWVFPAITLVTAVLSINLIGDGLREAIDPRSRGR